MALNNINGIIMIQLHHSKLNFGRLSAILRQAQDDINSIPQY